MNFSFQLVLGEKLISSGRSLGGLGVAFQVLMPEDSGSNPEAGSIYSFEEVCPGLAQQKST